MGTRFPLLLLVVATALFLCASLLGSLTSANAAQDSTATWQRLTPTGGPPPPRGAGANRALGYGPASNRMIVFGGQGSTEGGLNDLWVLSGADGTEGTPRWQQLATLNTPAPRLGHAAAYDPERDRLIVYGGCLGLCTPLDPGVYVLNNASGGGGTPAWEQLNPAGEPPADRLGHTMVYDPASNRAIMFGGADCCGGRYNDTWVLTNANGLGGPPSWERLSTSTLPPVRNGHSAVYDVATGRMVVMGGNGIRGLHLNDVWVLSNANGLGGPPVWTPLLPSGPAPVGRNGHGAVYDPATDRMIVFGGNDPINRLNDVWVLSHPLGLDSTPSWSQSVPVGAEPQARTAPLVAYRPTTNRMVVFGGGQIDGPLDDTWVLQGANLVASQPPAPSLRPSATPLPTPQPLSPGDIVVADSDAFGGVGGIIRIDPVTGEQTPFSVGGNFVDPFGIAIAPNGDLFVADPNAFGGAGGVIRVDPRTGAQTPLSAGGRFVFPYGIVVAPNGDILVADPNALGGGGAILRINPVSGVQSVVSSGGYFVEPDGIALAPNGDILVADVDALDGWGAIIRVDPASGAQTLVASGGHFVQPIGVAVAADGGLLVADSQALGGPCAIGCGGVIRVDPPTGTQTPLSAGGRFARPTHLVLAADGLVLVTDGAPRGSGIVRVDPVSGAQAPLSSGGNLVAPAGIAIVPAPGSLGSNPGGPTSFAASPPTGPAVQIGGAGGQNLRLRGEPATLSWIGSAGLSGYLIGRWTEAGLDVLPAADAPLPSTATSFVDASNPDNTARCYALLSLGATGIVGSSDVLCLLSRAASGPDAPGPFTIQLSASGVATLSWGAPPWQTDFRLTAMAPDGSVRRVIPVANGGRNASDDVGDMVTCYRLEALSGLEVVGTTDVLCAVPGLSASGADRPGPADLAEIGRRLEQLLRGP